MISRISIKNRYVLGEKNFLLVSQPIWSVKYTKKYFEDGSICLKMFLSIQTPHTKYHAFYLEMHNCTLFSQTFLGLYLKVRSITLSLPEQLKIRKFQALK